MLATQFLFQRDFNQNEFEAALQRFWKDNDTTENIRSFADQLIRGVEEHRAEIDGRLQGYAQNWQVARMGAVDRNVMRMALYEMFHCLDIPPVVSINEAVDIAKEFSSIQSGHFVNGILDRAKRDLDRPLRTAKPVNINHDWTAKVNGNRPDQSDKTDGIRREC